jgi:histidinol dehydrogenase
VKVVAATDLELFANYYRDGWSVPEQLVADVAAVLREVRARGDAALIEHARRFDDAAFDLGKLRVAVPMADGAAGLVAPEIVEALKLARDRLTRFHERQRRADVRYAEEDGTRYGFVQRPLESVAIYVPGRAPTHASVVLMGAVPAQVAGVARIIVLTPPQENGHIAPLTLAACALSGVDEIYAVGGAHAIAAAAYGTESIDPVEKIVGPGNAWVAEAKRQVFGRCGIDTIAGPGEMLVVADDAANSEYVAGELLAQAESDPAARVAVVSESRSLLEAVAQLLDSLDVATMPRGEVLSEVIERNCRLIHASSIDDVFESIDRFAPGYLSLQVRDPDAYLPRIRRAGAIFIGAMTPAASAYIAGTNAVVPTSGTAKFATALSLADFMRSFSLVECSAERMVSDAPAIAAVAELEGLPAHAQSARMRDGG